VPIIGQLRDRYGTYSVLELGNIKLRAKFEVCASIHFRHSRAVLKVRPRFLLRGHARCLEKDTIEFLG